MKILYFDVETTGQIINKHEILQIAGIIEIDGVVKETFDFYCRPYNFNNIDPNALRINNFSMDFIKSLPYSHDTLRKFNQMCNKYLKNTDNNIDKFIAAGHKLKFDIGFLKGWFYGHKGIKGFENVYLPIERYDYIDLNVLMQTAKYLKLYSGSCHLKSICEFFGIKNLKPHNALSDITATRECILKVLNLLRTPKYI